MSKFIIGVTVGIAKVYPYGQQSENTTVLKAGQALLCEVPVGNHVEPVAMQSGPKMQPETKELLKGMAEEDKAAPAAGVDDDSSPKNRAGTVLVVVLEGVVTLRTYEGSMFTEQTLGQGEKAEVALTESNRITLAVYDAVPVVDPRT